MKNNKPYNSISIEGPEEVILAIKDNCNMEDFSLNDLYPVPLKTSDEKRWKKTHWGVIDIDDIYINYHKTASSVPSSVEIGFEADDSVAKWVDHIAKQFPDVKIDYEVDFNGDGEYRRLGTYEEGKRISHRPTLF